jgi:hypothetical protein
MRQLHRPTLNLWVWKTVQNCKNPRGIQRGGMRVYLTSLDSLPKIKLHLYKYNFG